MISAQSAQALHDALLAVVEVGRIEALPDADVLADVPLDRRAGRAGSPSRISAISACSWRRWAGSTPAASPPRSAPSSARSATADRPGTRGCSGSRPPLAQRREARVGGKRRVGEADPREHQLAGSTSVAPAATACSCRAAAERAPTPAVARRSVRSSCSSGCAGRSRRPGSAANAPRAAPRRGGTRSSRPAACCRRGARAACRRVR